MSCWLLTAVLLLRFQIDNRCWFKGTHCRYECRCCQRFQVSFSPCIPLILICGHHSAGVKSASRSHSAPRPIQQRRKRSSFLTSPGRLPGCSVLTQATDISQHFFSEYRVRTPRRVQLIDAFLVFAVLTGLLMVSQSAFLTLSSLPSSSRAGMILFGDQVIVSFCDGDGDDDG